MEDLTFGEQVKIVLGRKGMTIKQLAELIEAKTGKKMSRQNLTQRLSRDNFQEQDMRMIAGILECPFQLSILSGETQILSGGADSVSETAADEMETEAAGQAEMETAVMEPETSGEPVERDMTIGELYEIHKELSELEQNVKAGETVEEVKKELEKPKKERFRSGNLFMRKKQQDDKNSDGEDKTDTTDNSEKEERTEITSAYHSSVREETSKPGKDFEPVISRKDVKEDKVEGDINPYTGQEYLSNSVRMHPTRIGYVQVYDRSIHKWTDMTEWAFLGLQERKKALLGDEYEPPIYLD